MGFINLAERTVHAKLVYYGIGSGGKTTSLQSVHGIMCPSNEVKLVSINTEEDATLLFDFLPIDLGTVEGFKIVIQGFTVPGQPKYRRMRKYVLQGADAVVLVVDSQRSRLEENIEALVGLKENLKANGLDPETIPIVVQYNKRDLDDILTEEEMDPHFLFREDVQAFPSVATESQGVYETFVHSAGLLVEMKIRQYNLGQGTVDPAAVAESARGKLWRIFDDFRHGQEQRRKMQVLELTVDEPEAAGTVTEQDEDDFDSAIDAVAADDDDDSLGIRTDLDLDAEDLDLDLRPQGRRAGRDDDYFSGPRRAPLEEEDDEELDATEDEEEFERELRDAEDDAPAIELGDEGEDEDAISSGGELFSDADLDIEFGSVVEVQTPELVDLYENGEEGLLDKALQSNLDLAAAFGELDQYKAALQRKNEELIKIAQNSIHDLRKPLSAIKLMLNSALKGYLGELNGNLGPGMENALMAVNLMERLIEDMTDSMKFDTEFRMNFVDVDMTLLVGDVVTTLRYLIEDQDVGIRVEPLPIVVADEWTMTKAFMNLIGNAIQYSSPDRRPRIRISYEDADDYNCFLITDNGIGIPEGQIDKLFLRFERGSNVSGISGTGLGLHIVKETVMGHGGHIMVDSVEGEGTTFRMFLPKAPVEVPQSDVSQSVVLSV